jgi:hypothetical protein
VGCAPAHADVCETEYALFADLHTGVRSADAELGPFVYALNGRVYASVVGRLKTTARPNAKVCRTVRALAVVTC